MERNTLAHNRGFIKIISGGFPNNTKKRKLSEAPWINTLISSLNKQEKSIPLKFLN